MKYPITTTTVSLIPLLLATLFFTGPAIAGGKVARDEIAFPAGSPQLENLKIEPVIAVTAPTADPLNGKISFDENYTARITSPVIGRALQINAQIGDKVKSGQGLIVIDSPDLGSAMADARKAEADLQLKKQALERSRMLLEGGVIPQKEYEASQADMSEASAEAMRARARLKNLGASNSKSTNSNLSDEGFVLRAPLNGIIVDRQINPGSEVRPDLPNPLFIITDPSHLWATIDLPERDLNKINEGQSISIEVDAYPGETFPGRVQSVGAMVDPASRRIPVRCIVLDGKGKLRPEMYARITPLSASAEKVIQVPNKALITEGLYSYVFVEVGPGRLKKRQVTLNTQGRDFATVKEGLQAGDRLVTSGAILLNSELSEGK